MACALKASGGLYQRLRIGAVLLAAGEGRRMGGVAKPLIRLQGVPLITRHLVALSGAGVDEVVVVTGYAREAVEEQVRRFIVTLAHNEAHAEGQDRSVRVGLSALSGDFDAVIVVLADQPLIGAGDLTELIGAFKKRPAGTSWFPWCKGARGNPIVLDREAHARILASETNLGCRHLIERSPSSCTCTRPRNTRFVTDLDTPRTAQRRSAPAGARDSGDGGRKHRCRSCFIAVRWSSIGRTRSILEERPMIPRRIRVSRSDVVAGRARPAEAVRRRSQAARGRPQPAADDEDALRAARSPDRPRQDRANSRASARSGGTIVIGAMTTENELIWSKLLQDKCPLLVEGARLISDPQVRYKGTIGGDISHGDPGNDHPALMLALGASFVLRSASGERVVPADGFFVGTYDTVMKPDEIMTEIRIPVPAPGTGYCYSKLKRKIGDFATAAAAVTLRMKGDTVQDVSIALTNVGRDAAQGEARPRIIAGQGADRRRDRTGRRSSR